jgi:two-component system, NarL family, nitrate/nitrite response regulator NarL
MSRPAAKDHVLTTEKQEYVVLETRALLKRLIECAERDIETVRVLRRTSELVDEIIFETNLDGISYYLVRSKPEARLPLSLSPRELAIGRLIAKGMPNKCIGDILEISPWTVATHLRRIFVKLSVTSRAAMVARLGQENLL